MGILVLGAGGQGQVVADILLQQSVAENDAQPAGFLDDNPTLTGTTVMGLPVIGGIAELRLHDHGAVIVAIGDNATRKKIFVGLQSKHEHVASAVHPAALVSASARLGRGVMIEAGANIGAQALVGDGVIVGLSSVISHHVDVGSYTLFGPGACVAGGACIGQGALIGASATILPGISVGEWAIIGAGAVVTTDVPAHATVVGAPARIVKPPLSLS